MLFFLILLPVKLKLCYKADHACAHYFFNNTRPNSNRPWYVALFSAIVSAFFAVVAAIKKLFKGTPTLEATLVDRPRETGKLLPDKEPATEVPLQSTKGLMDLSTVGKIPHSNSNRNWGAAIDRFFSRLNPFSRGWKLHVHFGAGRLGFGLIVPGITSCSTFF